MIAIPDPCQEDFSKMTPTERGAFCEKCSTDTYDFRKLSNQAILKIVAENKGKKMCGQFRHSQLKELNQGYAEWKGQTPRTFRSKFIFALLIGFGLTLFSCEEKEELEQELSSIEQIVQTTPTINYINQETSVTELDLREYVADIIPEIPEIEPIDCDFPDYVLGGDIAYEEEVILEERYYTTGGVPVMTEAFKVYAIEVTDSLKEEETTLPEPIINSTIFTTKAFPNPTHGITNLQLQVEKEGQFAIQLFNSNGQLIRNIHSGILVEGRQSFEIDLYDQNSGMYLIRIVSEDQAETVKIHRVN